MTTNTVLVNNLCSWPLSFRRLAGQGDIEIPGNARNYPLLSFEEVMAQIQTGNVMFTGTDNMGNHARIQIIDEAKRKELFGLSEVETDPPALLNEESVKELLAIRQKKWNEEDKGVAPENRKPIKIFINSDGGSVDTVLHVIDMIRLSKTPIYTIGMGRVYSAGGLLLMAGHKRYIFSHTSCLIHDGSSGAIGSIGKMLDNLEFTKRLEEKMKQYILTSTHITDEMYTQNYRRDWFLFSEEMIELGIADEIVTDIDTIL